uniref:Uncharacterized protein n=1 Tax=Anguilla anguilla TaxID=7936 RepID=A0A0E9R161_ANGAN
MVDQAPSDNLLNWDNAFSKAKTSKAQDASPI